MTRFRVTAKKYIYFNTVMAKKGPAYLDCNSVQSSCSRRKAKPRHGCPDCEYTIQYKYFVDSLEKELKTLPRGTREGARKWPSKHLIPLVMEIAALSSSSPNMNSNWGVVAAMLVSVYRDEIAKRKFVTEYVPAPALKPGVPSQDDGE